MRKQKIILWTAVLLIAATGCGNKTEQLVEKLDVNVETVDEIESKENDSDNADTQEDGQKNPAVSEDEQSSPEKFSQSEELSSGGEVLEGSVTSINEKENFVVINKIITEETEDGASTAVMMVGSKEEELITVYFTESTKFRVKTVINAGEEVSEKEGAFSDIQVDSILEFKGKMDSKGEEFLADDVVINEFIYK